MRSQQDLSQGDLAKLMDVSRQAVSKWENDQASPDTLKLIRLADILNTDIEYLATGKIRDISTTEPTPIVVNLVKRDEKIVERIVEKVVEKPIIRKLYRIKYIRNPVEFLLVGIMGLVCGLIIGILI